MLPSRYTIEVPGGELSHISAARLPAFPQGGELAFTEEINNGLEVQQSLAEDVKLGALRPFTANVKGFDEPFYCGS